MKKIILVIIMCIIILSCAGCVGYMNEQTVQCEVKDKWIKRPQGVDDELYLVNCGGKTYKVSDLLFMGKFNSADIYGNLEIGKEYKLEVTGFRWGYFSEYQNINSYELIEKEGIVNE